MQDLVRVLQIFNVRSLGSGILELNILLQSPDPTSDRYPHGGRGFQGDCCRYPNESYVTDTQTIVADIH